MVECREGSFRVDEGWKGQCLQDRGSALYAPNTFSLAISPTPILAAIVDTGWCFPPDDLMTCRRNIEENSIVEKRVTMTRKQDGGGEVVERGVRACWVVVCGVCSQSNSGTRTTYP